MKLYVYIFIFTSLFLSHSSPPFNLFLTTHIHKATYT